MYLRSIWTTLLVVLALVFEQVLAGQASDPLVKLASYHISKRPIHTVSDKFLSFTVDPNTIAHIANCQLTNVTVNIARSLTPSYIRLAGSESNKFVFQSNPNSNNSETGLNKQNIFSVSSAEWLRMNEFFAKTGMNVIACVSGGTESGNKNWDLSNTLELITFSDKHNISLDWQLGYELQRLAIDRGKNMGHDVTRLRKVLDVFPRYRKSLIIGPDMTSFNSRNDAAFVRNYLIEAGDSLDAFTWHPFSADVDEDDFEMLSSGMTTMDNYLWIKDGLLKSSSKGVVPKKAIWIAESDNKDSISNLADTMMWIKRMGAAARLGASVYLRKPHLLTFFEPTPEYWAAVLFKSLVGKTVLDIKQTAGNGTNKVHMFAHCTQTLDKPEESIINPMIAYERGSVTVYGVNTASESARLSFKVGLKADETAHLYILTEDSSGNFPKTLLNKQPLGLSPDNEFPIVSPKVRESPKYLVIPSRSIFFVVFPEAKCRSCSQQPEDQDSAKIKNRIFEEDDLDSTTFTNNVLEVMEDENDHDAVYVSYPKRNENMLKWSNEFKPLHNDKLEHSNPRVNVKYVTFSDDTWLSTFPKTLEDVFSKEKDDSADEKERLKAEKYRAFARALLGKRNITASNYKSYLSRTENPVRKSVLDDDEESYIPKRTNFGRSKRSYEQSQFKKWTSKDESARGLKPDTSNHVDENIDGLARHDFTAQMHETSDPEYFDEIESAHIEGKKRSIPDIYAVPLNDENAPEILASFRNDKTKQIVPILSLMKISKFDNPDSNDRMKRNTTILENSTIWITSPNLEASTTSPNDTVTAPVNSSEAPSSEKTDNTSFTAATPPPTSTTLLPGLQQNSSLLSEVLMESDNSKISREYRETIDNHDPDDQVIQNHHNIRVNERPNLRPVSPFPRKPKTVKSKARIKAKQSDNVALTRLTTNMPTQDQSTSTEPSTTSEIPVALVSQSKPTDQTAQQLSRQDAEVVSELKSEISNHKDDAETVSEPKTDYIPDEVVSKPKPSHILRQPPLEIQFSKMDLGGYKPKVQIPKPIITFIPGQNEEKPMNKTGPINLHRLLEERLTMLSSKHNAKMDLLRKRLTHVTPDSRIHKREVLEDAYESTKNYLGNVGDSFSSNFKSLAHWFGEKTMELGANLKRTRRDTESVGAARPSKRDHELQHLKEMIEVRKNELHRQLQKLAEDRRIKNAQRAIIRPRRDVQKIEERVQKIKQLNEQRHNEHRKKLQTLADEIKTRKNHPLVPKRNKRSVQEFRDKVNELHQQAQARRSELHKKLEERIEDKSAPQNRSPTKPKTKVVRFDEPHHSTKTEEPHHVTKIEEPHHSVKSEERHSAKIEEPRHPSKTEEPKLPKSTRKDSRKQRHHITRRDLTETNFNDNSNPDSKNLHFTAFPIFDTREDIFSDLESYNEFQRISRSLNNNQVIDDDDEIETKNNNSDHEEYNKIKLSRMSDLMREEAKSSPIPFEKSDDESTLKETEIMDSSSKNQICQLVNYNVFGYLWCLAGKMIHYLL